MSTTMLRFILIWLFFGQIIQGVAILLLFRAIDRVRLTVFDQTMMRLMWDFKKATEGTEDTEQRGKSCSV